MSEAVKNKCLMGDRPARREDLRRVMKECQEESFWYRALPLSLTSLAVTGALLYRGGWRPSALYWLAATGVLLPNKRFGPFPKLAVAGILGFIAGKASYARTCREKFHKLGYDSFGPGFGPGLWGPGFVPARGSCSARHCHHVCQECEKAKAAVPAETKSE